MAISTGEKIAIVIPAYNEEKIISATLDALLAQTVLPSAIVVVDNSSTDGTRALVERYRQRSDIIHLLSETKKGTGHACRAGFRYAIDECGATIVARIDADTLPSAQWIQVIARYFLDHPQKVLLAGPSRPLRDASYRWYDTLVLPLWFRAARLIFSVQMKGLYPLKIAAGHNLAIRVRAYDVVGGFTETSIEEHDEDVSLSKAVCEQFGFSSMGYAPSMLVYTSMRRLRVIGYLGAAAYYMFPDREHRLKKTGGSIDIR